MAKAKKAGKAKTTKEQKPSGYVAAQDFTQFNGNEQIFYKKGDEIPGNVHPNTLGKYIAGGFVIEKPAETTEEQKPEEK